MLSGSLAPGLPVDEYVHLVEALRTTSVPSSAWIPPMLR